MKKSIRKSIAGIWILASVTAVSGVEPVRPDPGGSPPPPLVLRPDAMVREETRGTFVGNDIYNQTGASQSVATRIARGTTRAFSVRLQNDGNTKDSFLLKPSGPPSPHFTVTYWQNGKNITSTVVAGKFATSDLAPRQSLTLLVKVSAKTTATAGSFIRQPLTMVSQKSPNLKDTVVILSKLATN
jgi:uncharacterized membrane protein